MWRKLVIASLLVGITAGLAGAAVSEPTAGQVVARFQTLVGAKLVVDRRSTYPEHYTALGVVQSIGNIGRYGRFTVWVVTSGSEEDVTQLLADPHTGQLGTPGAASIYWEQGMTIGGDRYWLAKKRYGTNLVLWWYGTERKVDARFKRLHRALLAIAADS